jgi:hypothetical protein
MATQDNKKPLGQSIRDLINPALNDSRKEDLQAKYVNQVFEDLVLQLPTFIEGEFTALFNKVANKKESVRNEIIIDAMTAAKPDSSEAEYNPIKTIYLPVSTDFTNFNAVAIREMPGYIKLHEWARDQDVAIKIVGLVKKDDRDDYAQAPSLVINLTKTYSQGAVEDAYMYPNLPEKAPIFGFSFVQQDYKL